MQTNYALILIICLLFFALCFPLPCADSTGTGFTLESDSHTTESMSLSTSDTVETKEVTSQRFSLEHSKTGRNSPGRFSISELTLTKSFIRQEKQTRKELQNRMQGLSRADRIREENRIDRQISRLKNRLYLRHWPGRFLFIIAGADISARDRNGRRAVDLMVKSEDKHYHKAYEKLRSLLE